eukprot:358439-Chlamydomonas_euryale.AAC.2
MMGFQGVEVEVPGTTLGESHAPGRLMVQLQAAMCGLSRRSGCLNGSAVLHRSWRQMSGAGSAVPTRPPVEAMLVVVPRQPM